MEKTHTDVTLPTHGAKKLRSVEVDSCNLEIENEEGFIGDKASKGAFRKLLDDVRDVLRSDGEDPLGKADTEAISKKKRGAVLAKGDADAAAVIQSAIETFAQQSSQVVKRFLRQKSWRNTECILFGGGFRTSRVG
jgi:hypothetical protein